MCAFIKRIKFYKLIILTVVALIDLFPHNSYSDIPEDAAVYLRSFSTFKANFREYVHNKYIYTGNILLSKPGLMKINYKTLPIEIKINGKWITYYDRELNEYSHSILGDSIYQILITDDFSKIQFVGMKKLGNQSKITVKDINMGITAELVFKEKPLILESIKFNQLDSDEYTTISFYNAILNQKIEKKEFDITPIEYEDGDSFNE